MKDILHSWSADPTLPACSFVPSYFWVCSFVPSISGCVLLYLLFLGVFFCTFLFLDVFFCTFLLSILLLLIYYHLNIEYEVQRVQSPHALSDEYTKVWLYGHKRRGEGPRGEVRTNTTTN